MHTPDEQETRSLTVSLDGFAWEALHAQSASLGVSAEELVRFSLLYYLADCDSGRVARRLDLAPHAVRAAP